MTPNREARPSDAPDWRWSARVHAIIDGELSQEPENLAVIGKLCDAVASYVAARASRAVGEPDGAPIAGYCPTCYHPLDACSHCAAPRAVGEGGTPPLVAEFVAKHASLWLDRDESYWLARLMQEVGELASSLVGDHPDPVAHELAQVASIAINWMYRGGYAVRAALGTPGTGQPR